MKTTAKSACPAKAGDRVRLSDVRRRTDGLLRFTVLSSLASGALLAVEWLALPLFLYTAEQAWLPWQTAASVAAFTLVFIALRAATQYTETALCERRDAFRTYGCTTLAKHAFRTPYARITDKEHRARLRRATAAMGRHIYAPLAGMWEAMSRLGTHALCVLLCGGVLLLRQPSVCLLTAVTATVSAFVHHAVTVWGERDREKDGAHEETLSYVYRTASSVSFAKDIRVFGLAPWLKAVGDRTAKSLEALHRRRARMYFLFNAIDAALVLCRNSFGYVLLLQAVADKTMPLSWAFLCFAAIGGLAEGLSGVAENGWLLRGAYKEWCAFDALLSETDSSSGEKRVPQDTPYVLTLQDVSFHYPAQEREVLSSLSFTLCQGESIGILGESGAGKSTLARLLCGLLEPVDGAITLNGISLNELDRQECFSLFSTVLQGATPEDVTLEEFVAASDAVDGERLQRCLASVGLSETVSSLADGVRTPIGRKAFDGGVMLSGGQLQRLMLARALYKDGPLWILDEPQTALDPLAEQALYAEYQRLTRGKCAVVLSDRPAVTRWCDRVIVLKNGTVAEAGTHEELMALDGVYAALFRAQAQYYREGRDPDDAAS